jgi:hypothetical protein
MCPSGFRILVATRMFTQIQNPEKKFFWKKGVFSRRISLLDLDSGSSKCPTQTKF